MCVITESDFVSDFESDFVSCAWVCLHERACVCVAWLLPGPGLLRRRDESEGASHHRALRVIACVIVCVCVCVCVCERARERERERERDRERER